MMRNQIRKYLTMVFASVTMFTFSYSTAGLYIPDTTSAFTISNGCGVTLTATESKCDTTIKCTSGPEATTDKPWKGKNCRGHMGGKVPNKKKDSKMAEGSIITLQTIVTSFPGGEGEGGDNTETGPKDHYCDCNWIPDGEEGAPGDEVPGWVPNPS